MSFQIKTGKEYLSTFSVTFLKIAFHLRSSRPDSSSHALPLNLTLHLSPKYNCCMHQIIFYKKTSGKKHTFFQKLIFFRLFQKLMSTMHCCISSGKVFTIVECCCCGPTLSQWFMALVFLTAEVGGSLKS